MATNGHKPSGDWERPVPVQMWQGLSPIPVQMWQGRPGPGADVAEVSAVLVQMWQGLSPVPVQMWPR